jgi:hypothetical protein
MSQGLELPSQTLIVRMESLSDRSL